MVIICRVIVVSPIYITIDLATGGRLRMDPNDDRLLPLDDHNPNCNEPSLDNSKSTKPKKGRCLRYLNITCVKNLVNRIIIP